MTKLKLADLQGFTVRGYNFPVARYLLLEILDENAGRQFVARIGPQVTTAEPWDDGKPSSTLNVAFTHKGLARLGLPECSLLSFPQEFIQGMKARANILGDTGKNAPDRWDSVWLQGVVHAWLAVHAQSPEVLDARCRQLEELMAETGGARIVYAQEAAALIVDGKPSPKEHFGYTDGFSNPDFEGAERKSQPGQGKLNELGGWVPLATGEFILGYPDEAEELPPAPVPNLLANNGTFMVYRKLHQNVASFRNFLEETGKRYPGGKEKLAAKLTGRWRDGTPVELSPDKTDPDIVGDPGRNTNFTYGNDPNGVRCPLSAHLRRVNPRDAFGFNGRLVNRRRIARRGLPYGPYAPEDQPARDEDDRGIIFMALGASLFRQFEFVQQQWIEYGNDSRQGNDKDPLIGNHSGRGKFMIQGTADPQNPPFLCGHLPSFVELRGGEYFFLPGITALGLIAGGSIDPR